MRDQFEAHIHEIAKNLPYPDLPSKLAVKQREMRFSWQYALLLVFLCAFGSLTLPDVRAAVLEFLQIGAVTIYLDGTSAEGEVLNLADVIGETTLENAQAQANFALLIPPDDLPDRVFVQDNDLIILVWIRGNDIEKALYQTSSDAWRLSKIPGEIIETEVGGNRGYWASGGVMVHFSKDGIVYDEWTHFVNENVLGWEQDGITLRLETSLSLEDARILAESLKPLR